MGINTKLFDLTDFTYLMLEIGMPLVVTFNPTEPRKVLPQFKSTHMHTHTTHS